MQHEVLKNSARVDNLLHLYYKIHLLWCLKLSNSEAAKISSVYTSICRQLNDLWPHDVGSVRIHGINNEY